MNGSETPDTLAVDRAAFEHVESLAQQVAAARSDYDRKAEAAKTAKKVLDAAHENHDRAVNVLIDKARGRDTGATPLFDEVSKAQPLSYHEELRADLADIGLVIPIAKIEAWTDEEFDLARSYADKVHAVQVETNGSPMPDDLPTVPPFILAVKQSASELARETEPEKQA